MAPVVYLNGEWMPRSSATIAVDDRGFLFGDGVYEVARAYRGRLFALDRHLARLSRGLRAIEIAPPDGGVDSLAPVIERLLAENGLSESDATVYLQITRGAAARTHHFPPAGTAPTVYGFASALTVAVQAQTDGGSAITMPDIRWARCDIKSVNLLPNVLAKQAAVAAGVTETIFVRDSAITEGSHTNVFAVLQGELRTYPECNYILSGVTREVVLELAAELGIPVRESPVFVHDIAAASEVMLTGTTLDVTPLVTVDGRAIGDGRPGPVARALQKALALRTGGRAAGSPTTRGRLEVPSRPRYQS